jgi:hypothetical protein
MWIPYIAIAYEISNNLVEVDIRQFLKDRFFRERDVLNKIIQLCHYFAFRFTLYAIATACLTAFFLDLPLASSALTSVLTFFLKALGDLDLTSGI